MKRFDINIEGFACDGEWWQQPDFIPRYAAQLSCPVKECKAFYTSEGKRTASRAQSDVRNSMRRHIKNKHPLKP